MLLKGLLLPMLTLQSSLQRDCKVGLFVVGTGVVNSLVVGNGAADSVVGTGVVDSLVVGTGATDSFVVEWGPKIH